MPGMRWHSGDEPVFAATLTVVIVALTILLFWLVGLDPAIGGESESSQTGDGSAPTESLPPPTDLPESQNPGSVLTEIEGTLSVANVTRGDDDYADSVEASTGDYVKLQAWYYNRENVDSGLYANDLTVRIESPKTRQPQQRIAAEIFGTNTNHVDAAVTATVPKGHVVRLLPDTAKWRHNAGTDSRPNWVTEPVEGRELLQYGAVIEDAPPCLQCEATVTVLGIVELV